MHDTEIQIENLILQTAPLVRYVSSEHPRQHKVRNHSQPQQDITCNKPINDESRERCRCKETDHHKPNRPASFHNQRISRNQTEQSNYPKVKRKTCQKHPNEKSYSNNSVKDRGCKHALSFKFKLRTKRHFLHPSPSMH